MSAFIALVSTFHMFVSVPAQKTFQSASLERRIFCARVIQGIFFNWYPAKKLKYGKPRLG